MPCALKVRPPPAGSAGGLLWLVILGFVLCAPHATAADGDFDPSFPWAHPNLRYQDARSYAVALQPDGKVVAAGYSHNGSDHDFAVVRYLDDASLDTTFSPPDGKAYFDFGWGDDVALDVALGPSGQIVVAGYALVVDHYEFAVVWFSSTGALVNYETVSIGSGLILGFGVAVQPDGKVVLAGEASNGSDTDIAVARLLANGNPDTTFSGDGKVLLDFGYGNDVARAVTLQPDGQIVVTGFATTSAGSHLAVARFGSTGIWNLASIAEVGSGSQGRGVAVQPDGKIVAVGYYDSSKMVAARFKTDGNLDPTFGTGGVRTMSVYGSPRSGGEGAYGVALRHDGTIMIAGYTTDNNELPDPLRKQALLRMSADGLGYSTTAVDLYDQHTVGRDIAIDPRGRSVVAGYVEASELSTEVDVFSATRFLGDPSHIFFDGFESGGTLTWSTTVPKP